MNLASIYIAICIASIGVAFIVGALDWQSLVLLSALAISFIGVPHGGLDHWTGRRLLINRVGSRWWIVFFPVYLAIAVCFAMAWFIVPIATVLLFFIISAWHFGREDEKAAHGAFFPTTNNMRLQALSRPISHRCLSSLRSIAVGGLVIWIPSLFRSDEVLGLLDLIIPTSSTGDVQQVLLWTQWLSMVLIPIAGFIVVRNVSSDPSALRHWVPVATVAIGILTPILVSFTIYFCAWHSTQGLHRLQRQERLSNRQFARATLPLSVMAVAGISFMGWLFQDATAALATGEQSPVLQTLFIGLSAIAVPHLLLHELEDGVGDSKIGTWQTSNSRLDTPNFQKGIAS